MAPVEKILKNLENEPLATGVLSDYKDSTDPAYVGPGSWSVIHIQAAQARDKPSQLSFITLMKKICSEFPCTTCRVHCGDYIKNHPMEPYLDTKVEVNGENLPLGLFVWSWKFHNAVNARLKKPVMRWDTAYSLYCEENSVCSQTCMNADHSSKQNVDYSSKQNVDQNTNQNTNQNVNNVLNQKSKLETNQNKEIPRIFKLISTNR